MPNVYEIVNNRILELLEQGTVPWHRPWNAATGIPRNLLSKKEYRGVNVFLLSCMPYSSSYWLTYKQATDLGGFIKRGEKSTLVVFWKLLVAGETGETDATGRGIPMLRYYNVFNLDQCEGVQAPETGETVNTFDPIDKAEEIVTGMPLLPEIRYGGNRAYYSPTLDYIQLPARHSFESSEEYYSTCFHELVHSTGHGNRLARKSILEPSYFGSHEYSKEELVAEMGAAFLSGYSGIENRTINNSAAYIKGWLSALKGDKKLLVLAAAQAQKAADYILNLKSDDASLPSE
jgi:antirestriction protein ArdC